ncbi:hypothetical protein [Desulfosarcina variabilis]|uniref:hypothetical protein n=1 Tax=Desulfosarcina variabilis TaxID=2300 RepID=UPI003AFA98B2
MMGGFFKGLSVFFLILLTVGQVRADQTASKWVSLHVDSKEQIRKIIQSEVERRQGFSTKDEDKLITSLVEAERRKEASAYKAAVEAATSEYRRAKKRLDGLEGQFQEASYDFEELNKTVLNINTTMANIDNQIARYQDDKKRQQDSLRKWLKTKKQGEVAVAVIYTRGFRDTAHELESLADQVSAPLMARHMGTYIQSRSNILNNVLTKDFIRAVEEGTAKWNRDEPLLFALMKGPQGTTYLRIKRYELYPYQAPDSKTSKTVRSGKDAKARILTSMDDLKAFLAVNNFSSSGYNFGRVESILKDIDLINRQAEEDHREQLISFSERIENYERKIASARKDKEFQRRNLTGKQEKLALAKKDLEVLRLKKESAQMAFQDAQTTLQEKKRVHESIIIKTSLVTVKRSQTPAEASAEAVSEGLKDVLNDARLQHSSSTTDVVGGKLVAEDQTQSMTDARILALCPISFLNEGDAIRVKMAFRVRTVLDDQPVTAKTATGKVTRSSWMVGKTSPSSSVKKPSNGSDHKSPSISKTKPESGGIDVAARTPADTQPILTRQPPGGSKPIMSAEALACVFDLQKVDRSGKNLIFYVRATNTHTKTQYLLFYDETCECDRSMITDAKGKPVNVSNIYLWQDDKKTSVVDAHRGLAMEPGKHLDIELVFDYTPNAKTLVMKPIIGTRTIFYRWWSEDVTFKNFDLP